MSAHADSDSAAECLSALGLVISEPERVLICTHDDCGYAVQVSDKRVSRHLWEKHHVPKECRRGVDQQVRSLNLFDPRQAPSRPDGVNAHPHLKKYQGLACRQCSYRTRSEKLIKKHFHDAHGSQYELNGRDPAALYDVVWLQSWVQEGARQYWIVRDAAAATCPQPSDNQPRIRLPPTSSARLDAIQASERARIADRQNALIQAAMDGGPQDPALISPWMNRTQWCETYRGARRDILVTMIALPSYQSRRSGRLMGVHGGVELRTRAVDEQRLDLITNAADELFSRCEETLRLTGRPILCWLYSRHPQMSSHRPFRPVDRASSKRSYRRVFKKFLAFLICSYLLGEDTCQAALNFSLTRAQRGVIARLWNDACWSCCVDGYAPSTEEED